MVTPIQKTKHSNVMTNYRPISVLPVLSKVLERVVYGQLMGYLSNNSLLSDCQSGFRPNYSTQDVLLHVTDSWRRAIDDGKFTAVAFLDISKAFDSVNHDILLSKLACYGVLERSLTWFASYLSCRQQRVCLQGSSSDWGVIHVGVPQGSILGPLLFSIYVNDLPSVIKTCDFNLYADDMEMHCSNVNLSCAEHDLQDDLNSVYSWLCINLLSLNVPKSNVMLVGSRQKLQNRDLKVTIDERPLSRVSSFRYLGLFIEESLTWREHTTSVLQRVLSRVHCLYRLNPIPKDLLGRLYSVFVLPVLDYCDVVWKPSSTAHFKQFERLHARFSNLRPTACSSVNVTLTERRRYHAAVQVYRVLHKLSPPYLYDSFHYAIDITSRTARNAHRLFVPRVRTNIAKDSFYFRGTQIWNSLNPTLYAARTLDNFKLLYRSFLCM